MPVSTSSRIQRRLCGCWCILFPVYTDFHWLNTYCISTLAQNAVAILLTSIWPQTFLQNGFSRAISNTDGSPWVLIFVILDAMMLLWAVVGLLLMDNWSNLLPEHLRMSGALMTRMKVFATIIPTAWAITALVVPAYAVSDTRLLLLRWGVMMQLVNLSTASALLPSNSEALAAVLVYSSGAVYNVLPMCHLLLRPLISVSAEPIWFDIVLVCLTAPLLVAHAVVLAGIPIGHIFQRRSYQHAASPIQTLKDKLQANWDGHAAYLCAYAAIMTVMSAAVIIAAYATVHVAWADDGGGSSLSLLLFLATIVVEVLGLSVAPRVARETLILSAAEVEAAHDKLAAEVQAQTLRWVSHEARVPAQILVLSLEEAHAALRRLEDGQAPENDEPTALQQIECAQHTCEQLVSVLSSSLQYARMLSQPTDSMIANDAQRNVNVASVLLETCYSAAPAFKANIAGLDISVQAPVLGRHSRPVWSSTLVRVQHSPGSQPEFSAQLLPRTPTTALPQVKCSLSVLRVQQIIQNLLSNALKYGIPEGTTPARPKISVRISIAAVQEAVVVEQVPVDLPASAAPMPTKLSSGPVLRRKPSASSSNSSLNGSTTIPHVDDFSPQTTSYSLRVEVEDNGRGMSAEDMGKLFKAFSQLRSSDATKGSGMGLNISARWLQQQGGELTAFSDGPGKGSTFAFVLPLHHVQVHLRSAPTPPSQPARLPSQGEECSSPSAAQDDTPIARACAAAGIANLRVLVVDDSRSTRSLMVRVLKREITDAEITQCDNGLEAVDCALRAQDSRAPFHLILTDGNMPLMDGYTATAKLRQLGVTARIVGITGDASVEDMAKFTKAGADAVLPKPVRGTALVEQASLAIQPPVPVRPASPVS